MQGLILAAGKGSRLAPYTDKYPKVLVKVQGTSLIMHTLERLWEQNVTETIIVIGYRKEQIIEECGYSYKNMKITYVVNEQYETTNNVYSFYLGAKYIHDESILIEGDLLFYRETLEKLMCSQGDCNILVSRYNAQTMNGTVIYADGNKAKALVVKSMQEADFDYSVAWKTVNMYRFSCNFMQKKLLPYVELYVKTGSLNSYYELVLGALIYYGDSDINIVQAKETEWFEVDDEQDLEIAKREYYSNCSGT
ncbi:MAG: phosphocholine cytidylyltransferase family protein [Lachnospiraceae bacterium]|nr:phosphocholine cytidylyltransferase family protein [Lachnospiraceae bacterium]